MEICEWIDEAAFGTERDLRLIGRLRERTDAGRRPEQEVAIALDGGLVRGHVVATTVLVDARIFETSRQAPRLVRWIDVVRLP